MSETIRLFTRPSYDAKKPHIVFPCFHAGFGDWVLINRIAAYVKRACPDAMLVLAVPGVGNPRAFLKETAHVNLWADAVCEVPCPEICADLNEHGGEGVHAADAALGAWLSGLSAVSVYRYSEYPRLSAFPNAVNAQVSAQRVFDLDREIADNGYLRTFVPTFASRTTVGRLTDAARSAKKIVFHAKDADDAAQFFRVFAMIAAQEPLVVFAIGAGDAAFFDEPWCVKLAADLCSVDMLAALLLEADLFAGNISGPMHLASAIGTKCIAYYFREWTMLDWAPRQPKPFFETVYKQAYGHDGEKIDEPKAYGRENANVARFEPVADVRLYDAVTHMLRRPKVDWFCADREGVACG